MAKVRTTDEMEADRLRQSVMSKIDRLAGARQFMTVDELKRAEVKLTEALHETANGARDEVERFAHLLLEAVGRHPVNEDAASMGVDMVVSFIYQARPKFSEILRLMERMGWPEREEDEE